jgi:hypothetical protein
MTVLSDLPSVSYHNNVTLVKCGRLKDISEMYLLSVYLSASESTLSRWSRLYLQSLAPTSFQKKVDVGQAAGRKNNAEFLSQHDVPTTLSGIKVRMIMI